MDLQDEEYLMVSMPLLKYTGVYQMFSPYSKKVFGVNIFKYLAILRLMMVIISIFWDVFNIYYFMDDFSSIAHYLIFIVSGITSSYKHYYIIRYSEIIWNCIHSTSINSLFYKYHKRQTLESGRKKSEFYSKLFVILWISCIAGWILSPLFLKNYFIDVKVKNNIYHYRINILNSFFPASDKFYNKHFMIYYIMEMSLILFGGQVVLIFDIILISMCIAFLYQLKTIADSYSTLGISYHYMTNSGNKMDKYDESLMYDFRVLLQDEQHVIENIKCMYKIFQPVTLLQIFGDSLVTILVTSAIIKNYFNGILEFYINSKLILTLIIHIMHLYVTCYLLTEVNNEKDSLNFALYNCDWTGKCMSFKKLLLYTMKMNSSIEYLNVRFTKNRIVNIAIFMSIMRSTYSITSVLVKRFSRNI